LELSAYITPLRRWWWLLVVSTLVAAVASFIATLNQPLVYQAKSTLILGRVMEDPNPDQGEIFLAQSLANAYAEIANREPVRNATMQALGLTTLPQYLAIAIPQQRLIEIVVTDLNPLRAQVVANELANQLILLSPTGAGSENQKYQEFIAIQLTNLQKQIEVNQEEIAKLQEELVTLNSASQLNDTQSHIAELQNKVVTLQGNYAALMANTQRGATNNLSVFESAALPTYPIGPRKSISILLATAIGFLLAAGAAYLLEYLDDTLKTPEEITRAIGVPVIGLIGETKEDKDTKNGVYVSKHPRSPIAEAYRGLRANLEFSGVKWPLETIMITSPNAEDGKSSVATNLAVVMAHGERNVILADADLHKPSLHNLINLSNEVGLSDLFRNGVELTEAVKVWDNNIGVITSGNPPPNPADLISSKRMEDILSELGKRADLVIIDCPPFIVSDALLLAPKVDGVVLVIRPGRTRKKMIIAMMEQFNRVGAKVLGVVLNRIPNRGADYYGGYQHYSPYYTHDYYSNNEHAKQGEL